MELDLITEKRLKEIDARIGELKQLLLQRQIDYDPQHILLDNSNLMRWLNVSRRTLQHYRDQNYIAYIQIDGKVFYTLADVMDFLSKHRIPAGESESPE